jgi:ribosomal protein S17E
MFRNRRPNFFETFDRAFENFGTLFDDFKQNQVKFFKSTAVSVNDDGITVLMKRTQDGEEKVNSFTIPNAVLESEEFQDKVSGFITGELAKIEEKKQQEQQCLLDKQKEDRIKELESELEKLKG